VKEFTASNYLLDTSTVYFRADEASDSFDANQR